VESPKTILVLDDDPSLRQMLRTLLEHDGYTVVAAADVPSALAQCGVELPDVMIVDLMLPVEDGEKFLREFQRRWHDEEVPTILLSASSARTDIARRLGVEASLPKPFFAEDLRELVRKLVGTRENAAAV
jgi:CheY-like chemotaxis protein